jgi:hypothetical protein
MTKMDTLDTLLDTYFDAGHAEGKEGRTHDTVEGLAHRTRSDIHDHINAMIKAETEACARLLELKNAEIRLMAGEMSSQEMRTVQAVLTNRATILRHRTDYSASMLESINFFDR